MVWRRARSHTVACGQLQHRSAKRPASGALEPGRRQKGVRAAPLGPLPFLNTVGEFDHIPPPSLAKVEMGVCDLDGSYFFLVLLPADAFF